LTERVRDAIRLSTSAGPPHRLRMSEKPGVGWRFPGQGMRAAAHPARRRRRLPGMAAAGIS